VKAAISLALVSFLLILSGGTIILVRDLHRDLAAIYPVLRSADDSVKKVDGLMTKVTLTADTLNSAANEERKNWQATSSEAAYTGRALRLLISRVDRSFVDGTLQHVNRETLPAIDSQIAKNGNQLSSTLAKLGNSADGLTTATGTLNARLDDPQIQELLTHFNTVSANLEVISANSSAMSGDMKLAVHRLAQPPTKFHEFLNVSWTAARFGSLFIP
jgi:hypothetical protein